MPEIKLVIVLLMCIVAASITLLSNEFNPVNLIMAVFFLVILFVFIVVEKGEEDKVKKEIRDDLKEIKKLLLPRPSKKKKK